VASATRAAHDPGPHVSARLNSALFSTAPNVSVPPPPGAERAGGGGAETFGSSVQ